VYPPAELINSFLPELPAPRGRRYSVGLEIHMDFHEIWREQCEATPTIRERFGVKSALDYLVGEKLLSFAKAADQDPEFAAELPRFQAAVWEIFNPYELRGYVASVKPSARRKTLQKLLYVSS
jgi:hypothetical protein